MASGSGSNFQSIIDAIDRGDINARINGLIAGKPHIKAIDRANRHYIPVTVLDQKAPSQFESELLSLLKSLNPDLIVLAGFLRKIPDSVVDTFEGKIINIHPSLLPKYGGKGFYGEHVHRAVIESGDAESGCTVHFVNEQYDDGDIIEQVRVPVNPNDTPETLAKRVLAEEHKLFPNVIAKLLTT